MPLLPKNTLPRTENVTSITRAGYFTGADALCMLYANVKLSLVIKVWVRTYCGLPTAAIFS